MSASGFVRPSASSGELQRAAAREPQSLLAAQHPSRKEQAAQQGKVQAPAAPADTAESGGLRTTELRWVWVWVFSISPVYFLFLPAPQEAMAVDAPCHRTHGLWYLQLCSFGFHSSVGFH